MPAPRVPLQVANAEHHDARCAYLIKDAVRKAPDQGTANVSMDNGIPLGGESRLLHYVINLSRESCSESWLPRFVPVASSKQFRTGLRAEQDSAR